MNLQGFVWLTSVNIYFLCNDDQISSILVYQVLGSGVCEFCHICFIALAQFWTRVAWWHNFFFLLCIGNTLIKNIKKFREVLGQNMLDQATSTDSFF